MKADDHQSVYVELASSTSSLGRRTADRIAAGEVFGRTMFISRTASLEPVSDCPSWVLRRRPCACYGYGREGTTRSGRKACGLFFKCRQVKCLCGSDPAFNRSPSGHYSFRYV